MKKLMFNVRKHENGRIGRVPRFQGQLISNGKVSYSRLAALLADELRLEPMDVDYLISKLGTVVIERLREGKSISLNWLVLLPTIKGGFDTIDAQFDEERNSLGVAVYTRPPLRDCMADLRPQNTQPGLKASVLSVMDNVACEESVITVPSRILVAGLNILVSTANPDEGVTLVNGAGEVVATPTILANTPSSLDLSFDALPADGEYVLVVRARSGESTDFAPAVARRAVVVRAAGN